MLLDEMQEAAGEQSPGLPVDHGTEASSWDTLLIKSLDGNRSSKWILFRVRDDHISVCALLDPDGKAEFELSRGEARALSRALESLAGELQK